MNKNIFIAGHKGMVGSAIAQRYYEQYPSVNIITANKSELDLLNQQEVMNFFDKNSIDQVYIAAAKVGGIHANNSYPADFIYENLMIQTNIIHSALLNGIKKLLFLGSSCIYPRDCPQPIKESYLLTGKLESSNEPYAIAKIAGIKLCESINRQFKNNGFDYRSVMPTNLYGIGDNYHPENSHVIPGLIRKFHEAKEMKLKEITLWGTGKALREFLFSYDLADACIFMMNLDRSNFDKNIHDMESHINIGSGYEISISEVAQIISNVIGYQGNILFDNLNKDGTPRKLLDSSIIRSLGWKPTIEFEEGISISYEDFKKNIL